MEAQQIPSSVKGVWAKFEINATLPSAVEMMLIGSKFTISTRFTQTELAASSATKSTNFLHFTDGQFGRRQAV